MPVLRCEACGRGFVQATGRPAKRCADCRGPAAQRYGSAHKRLRAAGIEAAYGTPCTRCGRPLEYGQELHLDHADGGGPGDYRGFSHASCNVGAGNRHRNGRPVKPARQPEQVVLPRPDPSIRHGRDCACGGAVCYPGPGVFWTSRCW